MGMEMEYCEHYELPKEMCSHCKGIDKVEAPELKTITCRDCGSCEVAWVRTPDERWCLYSINSDGQLSSVPHSLSCDPDNNGARFYRMIP